MNKQFQSEGQFYGKVALVTGAASGIGRATALAFAREGAAVVVADVAIEAGEETVRQIQQIEANKASETSEVGFGRAQFIEADVSDAAEVATLIQRTVDTFGRLDFAVNNAGIGGRGTTVADYDFADWERVLAINLTGVFYCLHYELKQMLKQGTGAIVNTASIAGLRGLAKSSAYSASKHGVIGLTKSAALEYARHNIRVNAVCPVFTRTPLFEKLFEDQPDYEAKLLRNIPLRRYGQPKDIAAVIIWLCSDASGFITGQAMPIDGGLTAR